MVKEFFVGKLMEKRVLNNITYITFIDFFLIKKN